MLVSLNERLQWQCSRPRAAEQWISFGPVSISGDKELIYPISEMGEVRWRCCQGRSVVRPFYITTHTKSMQSAGSNRRSGLVTLAEILAWRNALSAPLAVRFCCIFWPVKFGGSRGLKFKVLRYSVLHSGDKLAPTMTTREKCRSLYKRISHNIAMPWYSFSPFRREDFHRSIKAIPEKQRKGKEAGVQTWERIGT